MSREKNTKNVGLGIIKVDITLQTGIPRLTAKITKTSKTNIKILKNKNNSTIGRQQDVTIL